MNAPVCSAILVVALPILSAYAASSTSANYAIVADTMDAGKHSAAGATYSAEAGVGGIGGLVSTSSPGVTNRSGFVGQLYEVSGLRLDAPGLNGNTANEETSVQFYARAMLDDGTTYPLAGLEVNWALAAQTNIAIDANGLVSIGPVCTNTGSVVSARYQGLLGFRPLIVRDVDQDNYGCYARDGLQDFWQVAFFGECNPNAAPNLDPDNDGQSNAYEYVMGTVPTNNTSRFLLAIADVAGASTNKRLTFSPHFANRAYNVEFKPDLRSNTAFAPLVSGIPNGNGITDTNAIEATKFYRVRVSLQ